MSSFQACAVTSCGLAALVSLPGRIWGSARAHSALRRSRSSPAPQPAWPPQHWRLLFSLSPFISLSISRQSSTIDYYAHLTRDKHLIYTTCLRLNTFLSLQLRAEAHSRARVLVLSPADPVTGCLGSNHCAADYPWPSRPPSFRPWPLLQSLGNVTARLHLQQQQPQWPLQLPPLLPPSPPSPPAQTLPPSLPDQTPSRPPSIRTHPRTAGSATRATVVHTAKALTTRHIPAWVAMVDTEATAAWEA